MSESNYDFIARLQEIHRPGRRSSNLRPASGETAIDSAWTIIIPPEADSLIRRAASDLQEYLLVSMGVSVRISHSCADGVCGIFLECGDFGKRGAFTLEVTADAVIVRGDDSRGVLYGCIRLEDLMNYREAPYLLRGCTRREPLARMRSVHSGCGIDQYPEWQLNAILHAGFTAIDVFIKDIDLTAAGPCNINELIRRAADYGLDTVLYSYLSCYVHPDAPDAEERFDAVFGAVAAKYPEAAAIHLVGESLEFPSKDPATSGKRALESYTDGIPDVRPAPGWYPCCDYPDFIAGIHKAIRKVNPHIEIILNTYNWGWTDAAQRLDFLKRLPSDITVHTTFDIFKKITRHGLQCPVMDYSAVADEPGEYFDTEARNAASLGMRLRATTNTAGMTWDFGTVPYEPIPFRLARRMLSLKKYLLECGLDSFYETHHFGWWPNPANDLEKEIFFSDGNPEPETILRKSARRDYGEAAAELVVTAWKKWSDAMDFYVASNEDQYGPWRVGPAYPFIFQPNITRIMASKKIAFPASPYAHFGGAIVKTLYGPYENIDQTPGPLRYPHDIGDLQRMEALWNEGLEAVETALDKMAGNFQANGSRLHALGKFIRNSIRTTRNIKEWWLANIRLQAADSREKMFAVIEELRAIADREEANVRDTIPTVECDSRLGWEPSMEYVCDRWHLEWKLRQMDSMRLELNDYVKMLKL